MKQKKKLIIISSIALCLLLVVLILVLTKPTYTIKVEKVDDFSPDRRLIVYKNDKKIEFEEIQYTDKTYLCSGKNPSVSYSDIMNETELIVKIKANKQVIAKIVEK